MITCKHCTATAYCSTECRDLHTKPRPRVATAHIDADTPCFSYHTPAVCRAANVANRTLVDKLADTVDSLLPHTVQRALIWLQVTPYAHYWAQAPELLHRQKKRPVSNRIEFCYIGWMTYVDPMEFVEWSSFAILEMHKWLVDTAATVQQQQRGRQHTSRSSSDSCRPAGQEDTTLADTKEDWCPDMSWCEDPEVKDFAVMYQAWRGRLASTITANRVMTSDGRGRVIVVHHSKWGEVFHLHLKGLDTLDQRYMAQRGWDLVMCIRADRKLVAEQVPACWKFGARARIPITKELPQVSKRKPKAVAAPKQKPGNSSNDHQNVCDDEQEKKKEGKPSDVPAAVDTPCVRVLGFHTLKTPSGGTPKNNNNGMQFHRPGGKKPNPKPTPPSPALSANKKEKKNRRNNVPLSSQTMDLLQRRIAFLSQSSSSTAATAPAPF